MAEKIIAAQEAEIAELRNGNRTRIVTYKMNGIALIG